MSVHDLKRKVLVWKEAGEGRRLQFRVNYHTEPLEPRAGCAGKSSSPPLLWVRITAHSGGETVSH